MAGRTRSDRACTQEHPFRELKEIQPQRYPHDTETGLSAVLASEWIQIPNAGERVPPGVRFGGNPRI